MSPSVVCKHKNPIEWCSENTLRCHQNFDRNLLERAGNTTQQFATELIIILNCCHSCRIATFVGIVTHFKSRLCTTWQCTVAVNIYFPLVVKRACVKHISEFFSELKRQKFWFRFRFFSQRNIANHDACKYIAARGRRRQHSGSSNDCRSRRSGSSSCGYLGKRIRDQAPSHGRKWVTKTATAIKTKTIKYFNVTPKNDSKEKKANCEPKMKWQ